MLCIIIPSLLHDIPLHSVICYLSSTALLFFWRLATGGIVYLCNRLKLMAGTQWPRNNINVGDIVLDGNRTAAKCEQIAFGLPITIGERMFLCRGRWLRHGCISLYIKPFFHHSFDLNEILDCSCPNSEQQSLQNVAHDTTIVLVCHVPKFVAILWPGFKWNYSKMKFPSNMNCDGKIASEIGPGPWFNIKMISYQYRKTHCGDKTILRPSYLHNGISYTGKTTSLYWIGALLCIMAVIIPIPW